MKKFLIIVCILMALPVFADTCPYYTNAIPKEAVGVYQTGDCITIYSEPDIKSDVVKTMKFNYKEESAFDNNFAVLVNNKKLGLMYVTDIGDDNWVEVMYDKTKKSKGWVQTEDRFQFMPWINFYNMYGRKYGLRLLKDTPQEVSVLHAKAEELSQNVAKLNYAKQIKLTKISGNWALVSVYDLDKTLKMGYMRWRGDNGNIYAFPNVK